MIPGQEETMIRGTTFTLAAAFLLVSSVWGDDAAKSTGWEADPKLLAELEKRKVAYVYREAEVPKYTLPDPLVCADGLRVTSAAEWEAKRRAETLELFRKHVYGRTPKV